MAYLAFWGWADKYGTSLAQPQSVAAPVAQSVYVPSQEIVGLANKIGMPISAVTDTQAQIGIGQGASVCDPKYFVACYDGSTHTIRIYESTFTTPNEDPATSLAYEYGHYVWQMMPQAQKDAITPDMNAWYLANRPRVDGVLGDLERIEGGFGTPAFEDELHSTVCTHVNDAELGRTLLAHCTSYLPNRTALKNVF